MIRDIENKLEPPEIYFVQNSTWSFLPLPPDKIRFQNEMNFYKISEFEVVSIKNISGFANTIYQFYKKLESISEPTFLHRNTYYALTQLEIQRRHCEKAEAYMYVYEKVDPNSGAAAKLHKKIQTCAVPH